MAKHLVIIDGLSFLFRAYHGVRPLTRSDGLPTNALYGFAQMVLRVLDELQPDLCAVALDSVGPTFRKQFYPDYKAHRKEMDADMARQMPYFEPLIQSFGLPALRVEGVEADDIIATLVAKKAPDERITIVSSDKDLMQLIGPDVVMWDTLKNVLIGPDQVVEKFGVGPDRVIDVQALIGDSSDNVPGVPGVGPKTAQQLVIKYGSLDGVLAHAHEVPQPKLRESLMTNKGAAETSRRLVTLKKDVPISETSFTYAPTLDKARDFLLSLEFRTLAGKMNTRHVASIGKQALTNNVNTVDVKKDFGSYTTVTTPEDLAAWIARAEAAGRVAVDTETTSLDALQAELVGVSLAVAEGAACYIPLAHTGDMFAPAPVQLQKDYVLSKLRPLLTNPAVLKIGHNIKYDLLVLGQEGVTVAPFDDTMVMSFCLDGGLHNHGMDGLSLLHLNHTCISYKEVTGTGAKQVTFDKVPVDKATAYAAEDADVTFRLHALFEKRLADLPSLRALYDTVEQPLVEVLAAMERRGVRVDRPWLEGLSTDFASRLTEIEAAVHAAAGGPFNLNSPKQLGEVLFEKLGLPGGKRTQPGYSTDEDVLTTLAEAGHAIARQMLGYRTLAKLKGTYADALVAQINPRTGRVHTSYNQTGAQTGRLSSSDPNLQNIPIRTAEGRKIRHAFVAEPGWDLLSADYSQIELRLLAHVSGSEALRRAFRDGVDIHAFTAHQIYGVPLADVTTDQRRAAKTINFGIVYGMGAYSLAQQLGISNKEASDTINAYYARYAGIREWMDATVAFCRANGYVETLFGRRIHLPNISAKNGGLRANAERAAINAPLQGANADIIKMAMARLEKQLTDGGFKTRMLLQVHDELVFEAPPDERPRVEPLIRAVMEGVTTLDVPLVVGLGHGATWEDAH